MLCARPARSAGRGGQRVEFLERGFERVGPGPAGREVQFRLAGMEREPGSDVQQLVAQPFRFGFREFVVEQECLGPDDQVMREHHDLQPHLVERELLERKLGQAGVLVVTDAVLDAGALAMATLKDRDVRIGLVGQDRLEAVPVVIGERQLRAGVWTLTPNDHPGTCRPAGKLDTFGDLDDLAVLPVGPALIERGTQASSGVLRIAARTDSVSS